MKYKLPLFGLELERSYRGYCIARPFKNSSGDWECKAFPEDAEKQLIFPILREDMSGPGRPCHVVGVMIDTIDRVHSVPEPRQPGSDAAWWVKAILETEKLRSLDLPLIMAQSPPDPPSLPPPPEPPERG